MKKSVLGVFFFILCAGALFAQNQQQIEVIQEKDKLVTMTIEFIPSLDEARFIYSCPSFKFEQGDAILAVKERAAKFTKERGYFFYTYIEKAVTKYDNVNKIANYTAFIKFLN